MRAVLLYLSQDYEAAGEVAEAVEVASNGVLRATSFEVQDRSKDYIIVFHDRRDSRQAVLKYALSFAKSHKVRLMYAEKEKVVLGDLRWSGVRNR
jgi:hypothetical protein